MRFIPLSSCSLLFVVVCVALAPLHPALALSAATYSFTEAEAEQYVTLGSFEFTGSQVQSSWYSTDWLFRQEIVIEKEFIGEELTDFPVLVRLSDSILNAARDDLHDLVFTGADGTTQLAHSVEGRDAVWVKMPTLQPHSTTRFYVYYGNEEVQEDQAQPADVWSNNYGAVYFMNDAPEGSLKDETTHSNQGTSSGGMEEAVNMRRGIANTALYFDGTNDYISVPDSQSLSPTNSLTLSAWVKTTAAHTGQGVITKAAYNTADYDYMLYFSSSGGDARLLFKDGAGVATEARVNGLRTHDGKWHLYTGTFDGDVVKMYVDGALGATSDTALTNIRNSATPLKIAEGWTAGHFEGEIDQLTISSVARSAGWVRASHANQVENERFLTINTAVETLEEGSEISTITPVVSRALVFSSVRSFAVSGSSDITFQLSNDAGKTWLFYTKDGWKGANPTNPVQRSSVQDVHAHLASFPRGRSQFLWRAYVPEGGVLDEITIQYVVDEASVGSSVAAPKVFSATVQALNTLFTTAFNREPTFQDWTYWATRMMTETKPLDAWLGAMEYAAHQ